MRQALFTTVRRDLEAAIPLAAPGCAPAAGEYLAPQCILYAADAVAMRSYLMIQAHRKEDALTAEVALSKARRWPALFLRVPPVLSELSPAGDIRFRMSKVWNKEDHWWRASEGDVKRVIDEIVREVKRHLLPYLEQMGASPTS
jgi:hypothetical protein